MWTPRDAQQLLDALNDLGFPEHLFRRIHPMGHSTARYRKYCQDLVKPFTRSSSSQLLCAHMHWIVTNAGSNLTGGQDWEPIVELALKQVTTGAVSYRRLSDAHQRFLAEQIARLVEIASNGQHPMRRVARWQIRNTLWRWTVDGVHSNGTVVVDAAKACPAMWPMTARALAPDVALFHEHIVPRVVITDHLIMQHTTDIDEITSALRHHCLAAVVTKEDDVDLRRAGLRSAMPVGWQWGGDPWERYRAAGLFDSLDWPPDWSQ